MAAAAVSLPCPLRRSTRLAHAHTHPHHPATQQRQPTKLKPHHQRHHPRAALDPEPDQDSSSSDPENELTPRALRALKRQRLALDIDGLPFPPRVRQKKRRKENIVRTDLDDSKLLQLPRKDIDCTKRPSSPSLTPVASQRQQSVENTATSATVAQPSAPPPPIPEPCRDFPNDTTLSISISSPQSDARQLASTTLHELSLNATFPNKENDPLESPTHPASKPELSIPLSPISTEPLPVPAIRDASVSPEPLTPLTPLTPSPESSPSLPGHDRLVSIPPSPPHDLLPPPVSLENLPLSHSPDSTQRVLQQLPAESIPSPSLSTPTTSISLNPVLDSLIPFEGLPPQFEHELGVQMNPSPSQPPQPPQLSVLDFPEQFPPFQQPQIYVPPYPDPRREANIWKLACRERVDYILKYTRKTIKELLAPETLPNSQDIRGMRSPSHFTAMDHTGTEFNPAFSNAPSQTKFRLYTPASYTYSSTSWDSSSGARKPSLDEDMEDGDPGWAMDDGDWVDGDVDMEDDDEDDYEDDDDVGAGDTEREGEGTLGALEGPTIGESSNLGASTTPTLDPPFEIDKSQMMEVDTSERSSSSGRSPTKVVMVSDPPISSRPPTRPLAPVDSTPRASTPPLPLYPLSPPLTPERLPSLSSLHVPILSEPSRCFMGRGTPPDRRRLIEWSGAGRFATNGMGPPLYLSPVPQRHADTDVGIVPMAVDEPLHPSGPQSQPTHGEWTSFLYSMLEGDGVGVGVSPSVSVNDASNGSESAWYELGLGSVPAAVPVSATDHDLGVPLSHPRTPTVEQQVVDDTSSSSTLRFALG